MFVIRFALCVSIPNFKDEMRRKYYEGEECMLCVHRKLSGQCMWNEKCVDFMSVGVCITALIFRHRDREEREIEIEQVREK